MSEYVKLEDIEAVLADKHMNRPLDSDRWVIGDIGKSIADLPTIEIVRCKDCEHYNFETHGCKRNPSVERWWKDDYCSYGEKQVASKLKNADDSLLTADSNGCKEQKSKLELDLISRQAAIDALQGRK